MRTTLAVDFQRLRSHLSELARLTPRSPLKRRGGSMMQRFTMASKSLTNACGLALVVSLACSETSGGQSGVAGNTVTDVSSTSGASTTGDGNGSMTGSTVDNGVATTSGGANSGTGGTGGSMTSTTDAVTSGGGMGGDPGESSFVPEDLPIHKHSGSGAGIELIAATLREGANGLELYVAVRNEGAMSACDPAITVEFFDGADQSLTAWVAGLYSGQLYRASDGSATTVACLDPGELAMAGVTGFPQDLRLEELAYAVYRVSYFDRDFLPFDVVSVDSLSVSAVQSVSSASGIVFTGTLENGLEVAVNGPSVAVFPINGVGRPLGVATSSAEVEIAPGEGWMFETTPVDDAGVAQVVYGGASISGDE